MQKMGKLELTWVGKYEQKEIEPRILVENPELSYGDQDTGNMLIHGDNLIALKALEQDYAGKIKCIYIDPPYNTGARIDADGKEVGYDDGLEHSIWLSMMMERLIILRSLLSDDGSIWISIDEKESHYLKVICDEVFGRNNYVIQVTIKRGSVSGHKAINPTPVQICDLLLVYAKNKEEWEYKPVYKKREYDKAYNLFLENIEDDYKKWKIISLKDAMANKHLNIDEIISKYPAQVIRFAQPDYKSVGQETRDLIDLSKKNPNEFFLQKREGYPNIYLLNGNRILFYKDKLRIIDGKCVTAELVTNLWDDMNYQGIASEGGVTFQKGKKPESQIKRIFEMASNDGDLVLDSFLGSGTTIAVAQKMNRRWIGIELGPHCYTHSKKRIDSVINGEQSGISKAVNWQGGGGYKFYELAPSLLVPNPKLPTIKQINPEYTFEMMCEAICKLEGFKYKPDGKFHGKSSEQRFIHITKEFVNGEYVNSLLANLGEGQSLLVYGTKIQSGLRLPDNIVVKKIPKDLLDKCTFESEVK